MKCVDRLNKRLYEEFGVKELKKIKARNKRSNVGEPSQTDAESSKMHIPKVNKYADGGPSQQSAFNHG